MKATGETTGRRNEGDEYDPEHSLPRPPPSQKKQETNRDDCMVSFAGDAGKMIERFNFPAALVIYAFLFCKKQNSSDDLGFMTLYWCLIHMGYLHFRCFTYRLFQRQNFHQILPSQ